MKHSFFTVLIASFIASGAFAQGSPIFGSWACGAMEFTLDKATYKASSVESDVASVEQGKSRTYLVTLTDDYQFGLMDVKQDSLTWFSPWSDDVYDCKRK